MTIFLLCIAPALFADTLYDQAVRHFFSDNPAEAAALFQSSLEQGNSNPDAFIYLAYCYEQLGSYDKAITTLNQGIGTSQNKRHLFHFNLGNLYVQKKESLKAVEHYGLAINRQANYADAYLNRANTHLTLEQFSSALADYQSFVNLASDHELVPTVKRMIQALSDEIEAAAAQRKAEEERRQALLDEILSNLEKAGNEDPTLGAGTEDISTEEDDFSRAD